MIAVTASCRFESDVERLLSDPTVHAMSHDDWLIILGDSGVFEPRTEPGENISRVRRLPCRVLIIDGEHDDYDRIADHPESPWNGGMINIVSRDVYRLCRGSVFTLKGHTFLAIGGSSTPNREDVGKYWSWWPGQDISENDLRETGRNLAGHGGRVDFVLSCDCPDSWKDDVPGSVKGTRSGIALDKVLEDLDFNCWIFQKGLCLGHEGEGRGKTFPRQKIVPLGESVFDCRRLPLEKNA